MVLCKNLKSSQLDVVPEFYCLDTDLWSIFRLKLCLKESYTDYRSNYWTHFRWFYSKHGCICLKNQVKTVFPHHAIILFEHRAMSRTCRTVMLLFWLCYPIGIFGIWRDVLSQGEDNQTWCHCIINTTMVWIKAIDMCSTVHLYHNYMKILISIYSSLTKRKLRITPHIKIRTSPKWVIFTMIHIWFC